jgi:DNA-binding NtrC family response regulator
MPAPVLIAHRESNAREMLVSAIRAKGHEAVGFDDPLTALGALEADSRVRVLVTCVDFEPGKLNGIALANMLRAKRHAVKVVFIGQPEHKRYTSGAGEFMRHPVEPRAVAQIVDRLLTHLD